MSTPSEELQAQLAARFAELPESVQNAVTSADLEKRLRELATSHKLHVDHWNTLENEVMLTLLGFERPEQLEKNIQKEIGMTEDEARALATNINTIVFEPIRQELERQLEHPEAREKQLTGAEEAREHLLGSPENSSEQTVSESPTSSPLQATSSAPPPPTPPAPKTEVNVARAPASGAYKPGEASAARKSVVDDPYRELPQ